MDSPDLNPTPDGEEVAEMACTCVLMLVASVIAISIVAMLVCHCGQ